MNSELTALNTAAQVKRHYKVLGHAMIYGDAILASKRVWNDKKNAYDHHAAIFSILKPGADDAHTPVMLAAESDKAFSDQGHAFAWAIGMVAARD